MYPPPMQVIEVMAIACDKGLLEEPSATEANDYVGPIRSYTTMFEKEAWALPSASAVREAKLTANLNAPGSKRNREVSECADLRDCRNKRAARSRPVARHRFFATGVVLPKVCGVHAGWSTPPRWGLLR